MLFTKDSRIARIFASGDNPTGGNDPYGEIFVPIELYRKFDIENILKRFNVYTHDKNYSINCKVALAVFTIKELIQDIGGYEDYKYKIDVRDKIYDELEKHLELNPEYMRQLRKFNDILEITRKYDSSIDVKFKTRIENVIDGIIVPKGAEIRYTTNNDKAINNINFECDLDLVENTAKERMICHGPFD